MDDGHWNETLIGCQGKTKHHLRTEALMQNALVDERESTNLASDKGCMSE